jgi:hypothetical protein
VSSTATVEVGGVPARRRLALAAAVTAFFALIVLLAAVLVPQDAGWKLASVGLAAILAGPFIAARYVRRFVPVELRGRWAPIVTAGGWMALALVWLLSRVPVLVSGPAAFLLVVTLLAGPFCGAWVATRRWTARS